MSSPSDAETNFYTHQLAIPQIMGSFPLEPGTVDAVRGISFRLKAGPVAFVKVFPRAEVHNLFMSVFLSPTADATIRERADFDPRRRRRIRVPLIGLGALFLAAAVIVVAIPEDQPEGTLLGASGAVSGGIARINGVIPLDRDGWLPNEPGTVLTESTSAKTHRVRIILELTALGAEGIVYSANDFTITGLGAVESRLLWSEPESAIIAQGEVVTATQVFEIPNQAIDLILSADTARFALGAGHHSG